PLHPAPIWNFTVGRLDPGLPRPRLPPPSVQSPLSTTDDQDERVVMSTDQRRVMIQDQNPDARRPRADSIVRERGGSTRQENNTIVHARIGIRRSKLLISPAKRPLLARATPICGCTGRRPRSGTPAPAAPTDSPRSHGAPGRNDEVADSQTELGSDPAPGRPSQSVGAHQRHAAAARVSERRQPDSKPPQRPTQHSGPAGADSRRVAPGNGGGSSRQQSK
ncbi:hypothetical protein THAOC_22762, partial [Thalassiosira oceanica]